MALFRHLHRRNLYQHNEFSRPGKRRRCETYEEKAWRAEGVVAPEFRANAYGLGRRTAKGLLADSLDSCESSAETNVDDTTDYDPGRLTCRVHPMER